jgi:hypothetical protein
MWVAISTSGLLLLKVREQYKPSSMFRLSTKQLSSCTSPYMDYMEEVMPLQFNFQSFLYEVIDCYLFHFLY